MTLNELSGKSNEVKPVSINEIPAQETEKEQPNDYLSKELRALDDLIEDTPDPNQIQKEKEEENLDEVVAENLDNFDPEETYDQQPVFDTEENTDNETPVQTTEIKKISETSDEPIKKENPSDEVYNGIFDDEEDKDDENLFDDEESDADTDDTDDEDEKERIKRIDAYKSELNTIISNKNKVDTTGFKVSNKSITMAKLLNIAEPEKRTADWVDTSTNKPFTTMEYSGLDIQKLNPENRRQQRNNINAVKDIYRTLYSHIQGAPNTKEAFEAWTKATPYRGVENYYFGAYKATFGGLNVVTYECPDDQCKNIFIIEQPIDKMYEVDEDYKAQFDTIYNGDTTFTIDSREEIRPISDQFAIGLIEPSIYAVEIESLLITDEMRRKYSRIIGLIPFINRFYLIDKENRAYIPIDEQPVANDIAKTTKRRLSIYFNILDSLSNDQLAAVQGYAYNYKTEAPHIKFFQPECTCPKCKKIIPKVETSAMQLLFNRAQSVLLANISES